jgi:peptidoglycan hydrolase-like protein with peptidoglycan-binding domain
VHDPASTLRDGLHPWSDFRGLVKVYYTSTVRWAAPKPITDGHAFTVGTVTNGTKGPVVKLAQEILMAKGFYSGRLDGDAGPLTVCAIRDYQKSRPGLSVDGSCGLNTWIQLLELVRDGWTFVCKTVNKGCASKDSTRLVQSILKAQGYKGEDGKVLKVDGDCGNNTVYAIRAYQTKRHQQGASLAIDGSAGPATLTDMIGF